MPAMLVFLLVTFIIPFAWREVPALVRVLPIYIFWGLFLILFIEWFITVWRMNRRILARFEGGKELKRGNGRYAVMRMTTPRRLRQPVPLVARGESID